MEVVGAISAILSIAELGFQTATALGEYTQKAKSSSHTAKAVCTDLKSLAGILLQTDELKSTTIVHDGRTVPLLSAKLAEDIESGSKSCKEAFERVKEALDSASEQIKHSGPSDNHKIELSTWERVHWPLFLTQSKGVQSDLDVSKATLLLILNCAILIAVSKPPPSTGVPSAIFLQDPQVIKQAIKSDVMELHDLGGPNNIDTIAKALHKSPKSPVCSPAISSPQIRESRHYRSPRPIIVRRDVPEVRVRGPDNNSSAAAALSSHIILSPQRWRIPYFSKKRWLLVAKHIEALGVVPESVEMSSARTQMTAFRDLSMTARVVPMSQHQVFTYLVQHFQSPTALMKAWKALQEDQRRLIGHHASSENVEIVMIQNSSRREGSKGRAANYRTFFWITCKKEKMHDQLGDPISSDAARALRSRGSDEGEGAAPPPLPPPPRSYDAESEDGYPQYVFFGDQHVDDRSEDHVDVIERDSTKIGMDELDVTTLEAYDIPYHIDPRFPRVFIIEIDIDEKEGKILREHTARMRVIDHGVLIPKDVRQADPRGRRPHANTRRDEQPAKGHNKGKDKVSWVLVRRKTNDKGDRQGAREAPERSQKLFRIPKAEVLGKSGTTRVRSRSGSRDRPTRRRDGIDGGANTGIDNVLERLIAAWDADRPAPDAPGQGQNAGTLQDMVPAEPESAPLPAAGSSTIDRGQPSAVGHNQDNMPSLPEHMAPNSTAAQPALNDHWAQHRSQVEAEVATSGDNTGTVGPHLPSSSGDVQVTDSSLPEHETRDVADTEAQSNSLSDDGSDAYTTADEEQEVV